jgi:hypothetical protein
MKKWLNATVHHFVLTTHSIEDGVKPKTSKSKLFIPNLTEGFGTELPIQL